MSEHELTEEQKRLRARVAESEGSHYYDQRGNGMHKIEMISKPGEYRPVNKTDATKLALVPSVTNLLGRYKNRSGIEKWARQMIYDKLRANAGRLHAMHGAAVAGNEEHFDKLCVEVDEEAEAMAKEAARLGSTFHFIAENAVQHKLSKGSWPARPTVRKWLMQACPEVGGFDLGIVDQFINPVIFGLGGSESMLPLNGEDVAMEFGLAWNMTATTSSRGESSSVAFGVGGKFDLLLKIAPGSDQCVRLLDLLSAMPHMANVRIKILNLRAQGKTINVLLDWKTRKPKIYKRKKEISFPSYPSDCAQLSAYGQGLSRSGTNVHLVGNIFVASDSISIKKDGEFSDRRDEENVSIRFYSEEEVATGLRYFNAAAAMWICEEEAAAQQAIFAGGKKKTPFIPEVIDVEE